MYKKEDWIGIILKQEKRKKNVYCLRQFFPMKRGRKNSWENPILNEEPKSNSNYTCLVHDLYQCSFLFSSTSLASFPIYTILRQLHILLITIHDRGFQNTSCIKQTLVWLFPFRVMEEWERRKEREGDETCNTEDEDEIENMIEKNRETDTWWVTWIFFLQKWYQIVM